MVIFIYHFGRESWKKGWIHFEIIVFFILVLSFRYETFVKSRGGDFSLNTPGHGKATLAWKISVLLYCCQKKILHPVWVRLKKLGHSPLPIPQVEFSFSKLIVLLFEVYGVKHPVHCRCFTAIVVTISRFRLDE